MLLQNFCALLCPFYDTGTTEFCAPCARKKFLGQNFQDGWSYCHFSLGDHGHTGSMSEWWSWTLDFDQVMVGHSNLTPPFAYVCCNMFRKKFASHACQDDLSGIFWLWCHRWCKGCLHLKCLVVIQSFYNFREYATKDIEQKVFHVFNNWYDGRYLAIRFSRGFQNPTLELKKPFKLWPHWQS